MDTDVARVPSVGSKEVWSVQSSRVVVIVGGIGSAEHSREVCDGKRRILVEVLRLDEALEQVPAHGGWRAGRWMLWCWEVGMGVWPGVSASRLHLVWRCDDVPPRKLKRAGRFALNNPPWRITIVYHKIATSNFGKYHVSPRFSQTTKQL